MIVTRSPVNAKLDEWLAAMNNTALPIGQLDAVTSVTNWVFCNLGDNDE